MDKSEAAAKINQVYPELTIKNIEFLGSGYDSETFLLNQQYVFKFPRHARAANNLYKEALVLAEIKNKVPLKVPAVYFVGPSDEPEQLTFAGQEKIEGEPLTAEILAALTQERKAELGQELSAFFNALHSIDLETSIEGLVVDKKVKAAHEYQVLKETAYPLLNVAVQKEIDEVYSKILAQDFQYEKCLVHNDFGASNVYFDQKANKVCGVIDFGDVAIYDRRIDFICLLFDYEEGFDRDFVQQVLTDCKAGPISAFTEITDFIDFYNQLENIYLGQEFGMTELFEESIAAIQNGLAGFNENIVLEDKTEYYM